MLYALAAIMGTVVGMILGFFGSGGSILAIPMLVYGLGVDTKPAIAMSLVIVGGTALAGLLQQWRQGRVAVSAALLFGGFGFIGAFAGARVSALLAGNQQMFIFGVIMLAAALNMLRNAKQNGSGNGESNAVTISLGVASTLGVAVGFLTGLIGVGGGFLIVPALVFGGLSMHRAIGTSLMVIVMNSVSGVIGYWGRTEFQPLLILAFMVPSTVASILGSRWGAGVSAASMKKGFAVFLLVVAIGVLAKNSGGF